jgi:hypothetical protein
MKSRKCEIGIHGIEFDNEDKMKKEYELFLELTGIKKFGIRMHYVRNTGDTFKLLDKCGYVYDSTEHSFKNPYKIGNMWEFPFQLMDGWVIENGKSWQSVTLEKAKENTLKIIDRAHAEKLDYLGIDFHDRYFSHSFKTWLEWYMWVADYLQQNKIEFVNYNQAIHELENRN